MKEMEKLEKLLAHWREHNDEHAGTYKQWAEKASALGNPGLAAALGRLHDESKRLDRLFDEAQKALV